ncbi:MAG: hypothetical protein ACP5FK_09350 [bacterium]
MWEIKSANTIIIIAPLILIGVIMLIAGFVVSPEAQTDDGHNLKLFLFVMGAIFTGSPVAMIGIMYVSNLRTLNRYKYLNQHGYRGRARIVDFNETGTEINNCPVIKFKLEIESDYKSPYVVDKKETMNLINLSKLHRDMMVDVLIDPDRPKKIMILWDF